MNNAVIPLESIFHLEQIELNIFRGNSQNIGSGRIFGGQVLGQAITAAQASVDDDRFIHSSHAYFLRAGDHDEPVVYIVDKTRDGRRYSARTVTAVQKGRPICTIMCSFQIAEVHEFDFSQRQVDNLIAADKWIEYDLTSIKSKDDKARQQSKILSAMPFHLKVLEESIDKEQLLENYWLKTSQTIEKDVTKLHSSIFAYCSDFRLLASTLRSIDRRYHVPEMMLATICHAIWFHRDFRVDDWFFTQCEPLSVSNGRGLAKGSIYDTNGLLVATTMQEGVVMTLDDKK